MTYLLDTNVVSELRRPRPSSAVMEWVESTPAAAKFISVLTMGELRRSVELVATRDPAQGHQLLSWLADVVTEFADRTVAIDATIADQWGRLGAQRPTPVIDGLIAATALVNNWAVVTRNVYDFEPTGVRTLNPFDPR